VTFQLQVCVDDDNLLGENINIIKRNVNRLYMILVKKVVPKYMQKKLNTCSFIDIRMNDNHNIKIPNKSFDHFKYLGTAVTNFK